MSNNNIIMGWVKYLPNVSVKVLKYRNTLQQGVEEAEALERRAANIRKNVRAAQDNFLKHITEKWGTEEIENASRKDVRESLDHHHIFDKTLRTAILSMNGNIGPGDALNLFESEILKRQQAHLKSDNHEVIALLTPLLEWWVHAGAPTLKELKKEGKA